MVIKIVEIVGDRATDMRQGDQIYSMIVEQFEKKEKVTIDFDGLKTVLSTFLNNAIGALYKDYSSEYLNENLKVANLCQDDLFILKRVIKRAKDFYANEKVITDVLDEELPE